MQRNTWLALGYSVPIQPSKARVYAWRKLREFGAESFKQGLAVLPNTAQSMQQFSTLAQKIRQMGGEASIVELRFTDAADEAKMIARFQKQIDAEYQELLSDCANAMRELRRKKDTVTQQESERIKQMIKRYRKMRARDSFGETASQEIEEGINELIDSVREVAADFGKQLRQLMEG